MHIHIVACRILSRELNYLASQAGKNNWQMREINDDLRLLRMMVDGTWNDREFLILKPGERIEPDYTGLKLKAVPDM